MINGSSAVVCSDKKHSYSAPRCKQRIDGDIMMRAAIAIFTVAFLSVTQALAMSAASRAPGHHAKGIHGASYYAPGHEKKRLHLQSARLVAPGHLKQ